MRLNDQRGTCRRLDNSSSPENRLETEGFPDNIRDPIGEPGLAIIVASSVEQIPSFFPNEQFPPWWKLILGVLTYFYAIDVYPTDEIAATLGQNPTLSSLNNPF